MNQKANLDILRAFAVSCVILHHFVLTIHKHLGYVPESLLHFLVAVGHAGVLAFFVHTSLVLMYSLGRMHQSGEPVTLRFYLRRFFRIYPLAITAIILALIFHFPSRTWAPGDVITRPVLISNLLLVQNLFTKKQVIGPLWSLPYELQMYVVLPALFLLASRRRAPLYLGLLIAAFSALGTLIAYKTGHLNMAAYVPCFLSGVLCYALRHKLRAVIPAWPWPAFLTGLILSFLFFNRHETEEPTFWSGWIFCLVLGLAINLFRDSNLRALNYVAEKTAQYSYGIYLLHMPVLYLVFIYFAMKGVAVASGVFLVGTLIAAVVGFHTVEQPFMELGRRLTSSGYPGRESEAATIPAAP